MGLLHGLGGRRPIFEPGFAWSAESMSVSSPIKTGLGGLNEQEILLSRIIFHKRSGEVFAMVLTIASWFLWHHTL